MVGGRFAREVDKTVQTTNLEARLVQGSIRKFPAEIHNFIFLLKSPQGPPIEEMFDGIEYQCGSLRKIPPKS
jgi:hypothetical protein